MQIPQTETECSHYLLSCTCSQHCSLTFYLQRDGRKVLSDCTPVFCRNTKRRSGDNNDINGSNYSPTSYISALNNKSKSEKIIPSEAKH